jgi:hypothetical protein
MLGLVQDQLRSEDSMAHFAELNTVNVVLRVLVVHNNELMVDGVESEDRGVKFLQSLFGAGTIWKQTSYNANFRGKYAGIGDVYNPDTDEFLTPEEAVELGLPVQQEVPEGLPTMDLTVLETQPEPAITSQAVVDLSSTDLPAFTSSDVAALTSEQITGL